MFQRGRDSCIYEWVVLLICFKNCIRLWEAEAVGRVDKRFFLLNVLLTRPIYSWLFASSDCKEQ